MEIKVDDLSGPEVHELLREHLRNMHLHSPPESVHALDAEELRRPEVTFWTVWKGGELLGCGALHVLWEDIAEIRTIAVVPQALGLGIGHALLDRLVATAKELGVSRLFALTFEVGFFERHGFVEIQGTPVSPEVYEEMRRSLDQGVAEFLDLPYVKPNTLGNSRMLLEL